MAEPLTPSISAAGARRPLFPVARMMPRSFHESLPLGLFTALPRWCSGCARLSVDCTDQPVEHPALQAGMSGTLDQVDLRLRSGSVRLGMTEAPLPC